MSLISSSSSSSEVYVSTLMFSLLLRFSLSSLSPCTMVEGMMSYCCLSGYFSFIPQERLSLGRCISE